MTLIWAPQAQKDLLAIVDYIGKDAPERAHAYALKIKAKANALKRFPTLGRIVPELKEEIPPPREFLIGNYRLIYCVRGTVVEIIMIFHGRRRLQTSFE